MVGFFYCMGRLVMGCLVMECLVMGHLMMERFVCESFYVHDLLNVLTNNAPINLTAPCIIFSGMGPIALLMKTILPAKIMHRAV